MSSFLLAYQAQFDNALLAALFALSQFVVLRAGVFSVATAGLACIGAYVGAIVATRFGVPPWIAIILSGLAGALVSLILAIPLARLRGIFQAVATLAFGQIVVSIVLNLEDWTGGAVGLSGIPKAVSTWQLTGLLIVFAFVLHSMLRSSIGRSFEVVAKDETLALSLGISVTRVHTVAFCLSGVTAGLAGGAYAFHSYSLVPGEFGFSMLVATLTAVVVGGRNAVGGAIVGAAFLMLLPEIARAFEGQSYLVHGGLLVVVSIFLPNGLWEVARRLSLRASTNLRVRTACRRVYP